MMTRPGFFGGNLPRGKKMSRGKNGGKIRAPVRAEKMLMKRTEYRAA